MTQTNIKIDDEILDENDPFYSEENMAELRRRAKEAEENPNYFKEHDLIEE